MSVGSILYTSTAAVSSEVAENVDNVAFWSRGPMRTMTAEQYLDAAIHVLKRQGTADENGPCDPHVSNDELLYTYYFPRGLRYRPIRTATPSTATQRTSSAAAFGGSPSAIAPGLGAISRRSASASASATTRRSSCQRACPTAKATSEDVDRVIDAQVEALLTRAPSADEKKAAADLGAACRADGTCTTLGAYGSHYRADPAVVCVHPLLRPSMTRTTRRGFLGLAGAAAAFGIIGLRPKSGRADGPPRAKRVLVFNAGGGLRNTAAFYAVTNPAFNPYGMLGTYGPLRLGRLVTSAPGSVTHDAPSWGTRAPSRRRGHHPGGRADVRDRRGEPRHRRLSKRRSHRRDAADGDWLLRLALARRADRALALHRRRTPLPALSLGGGGMFDYARGAWLPYAPVEADAGSLPRGSALAPPSTFALEDTLDQALRSRRNGAAGAQLDAYKGLKAAMRKYGPALTKPELHVADKPTSTRPSAAWPNRMLLEATGLTGASARIALAIRALQMGSPAVMCGMGGFNLHSEEKQKGPAVYTQYARARGDPLCARSIRSPSGAGWPREHARRLHQRVRPRGRPSIRLERQGRLGSREAERQATRISRTSSSVPASHRRWWRRRIATTSRPTGRSRRTRFSRQSARRWAFRSPCSTRCGARAARSTRTRVQSGSCGHEAPNGAASRRRARRPTRVQRRTEEPLRPSEAIAIPVVLNSSYCSPLLGNPNPNFQPRRVSPGGSRRLGVAAANELETRIGGNENSVERLVVKSKDQAVGSS